MEAIINRSEFIRRWHAKAVDAENVFDKFFSAWIALVILARGSLDDQHSSQPDTDRKAIIQHFESNAERVVEVLDTLTDNNRWLAGRRGTVREGHIVDVYPGSPPHLRELFDTLSLVWEGNAKRKPVWVARATAELINHIRNHVFHGVKCPDDSADQELIKHLNPILLGVLTANG